MRRGQGRASIGACAALAAAIALALPTSAAAKPRYEAFGSCASAKPYKRAHRCGYDGSREARGTFVFRSNVGKRRLKVCEKITGGVHFDEDHYCVKAKGALKHEDIPFTFSGRAKILVRVTFFVGKPGAKGFAKAATARLTFVP